MRPIDLTNCVFNRLTALERVENNSRGQARWRCLCTCGQITIVDADNLKSGNTKSCGCLRNENRLNGKHKHCSTGRSSSTYESWAHMLQRCFNPNNHKYLNYGGRGITVCNKWRDFAKFLADVGLRPEGTSIDRINNEGHYEPGNVRWATPKEQANNRRKARF